jgi:type IV fimbrial biogenesis protein FimT
MSNHKGFFTFRGKRRALGFTVVEVSVSLGILAVGLAQAVPSMQGLIANNQVTAASNSLVVGLNQARSSAITMGQDITICPSSDASSCSMNAWQDGWIVFDDANANGVADAGEIIRASLQDNKLSVQGFGNSIVFQSDGTTSMLVDATISSCYEISEVSNRCSEVTVGAYGLIRSKIQHSS